MSDYYKEKLRVDLDLFRNYISIILVLSAGLATLALRDNFWKSEMGFTFLIIGSAVLVFMLTLCIGTYSSIQRDLKEIKKQ